MRRCPECEEPGYPTLLEWPERSQRERDALRRRYLLCVYCGHKTTCYCANGKKPGPPPIFTAEEQRRIIEMYTEAKMTSAEIAKRMYCGPVTVRNILCAHNVPLRPKGGSTQLRGVSHRQLELIRFLYEHRGWTQAQIAQSLSIGVGAISLRVRRGGMVRFGRIPEKKEKVAA